MRQKESNPDASLVISPDMSVETVRTENKLWHEAINKCESAKSEYKIPAPWYPAGQVNGYDIVPLDTTEEIWKEGREMHHCVGSYDYLVAAGCCYIYSVRQGDNRIATVELLRKDGKAELGQIKAACNSKPPKEVNKAVKKWFSEMKEMESVSITTSGQFAGDLGSTTA